MVRAIWGYKLLQCISEDGSTARLAVPFLPPKAPPPSMPGFPGLRIHFFMQLDNVILKSWLTVLSAILRQRHESLQQLSRGPLAVSLCFKLGRLIIIGLFFSQWLAALQKKIHLVSLLWLFLPNLSKIWDMCARQAFAPTVTASVRHWWIFNSCSLWLVP